MRYSDAVEDEGKRERERAPGERGDVGKSRKPKMEGGNSSHNLNICPIIFYLGWLTRCHGLSILSCEHPASHTGNIVQELGAVSFICLRC